MTHVEKANKMWEHIRLDQGQLLEGYTLGVIKIISHFWKTDSTYEVTNIIQILLSLLDFEVIP